MWPSSAGGSGYGGEAKGAREEAKGAAGEDGAADDCARQQRSLAGRPTDLATNRATAHRGPAAPIATSQSATLHREERGYTTTEREGREGRVGGGGAESRQRAHPWGRSGWTWLGESRKKRRKGTTADEVRGTETTMIRLEGNSGAWGSQLFFFNRRGIPSVLDISRSSTCICLLLQIYMHTISGSASTFFS